MSPPSTEAWGTVMTDRPGNDGVAHGANSEASRSFLQDVMDHTQQTWSHVGQGNASAGEYLEVVAEAAAVAVAAKFAVSRFLGKGGAVATKDLLVSRGLQTEILHTAPVALRQGTQKSVVCTSAGLLDSGVPLSAVTRAEGLHPAITALRSGSEALHPAITALRPGAQHGAVSAPLLFENHMPINVATRTEAGLHPAIMGLRPGSEAALHPAIMKSSEPALPSAIMGLHKSTEAGLHPVIMGLCPGTQHTTLATSSALLEIGAPLNVVTRGEAASNLGSAAFRQNVCGGASVEETTRRIAQIQLGAEQRLTAQLVHNGIPISVETRVAVKAIATMRPGARAEALRKILEQR